MFSVSDLTGPKRELVSLVTTETTAIHVTPELDLVLKASLMTTRVETKLNSKQTMETSLSKPWDISWCIKINCRTEKAMPFHYHIHMLVQSNLY